MQLCQKLPPHLNYVARLPCQIWNENKKDVLSQRWPRDAPTKVNKATPLAKITWLSVDSIQPDVMDVGVERTFSPPKFLHVPLGVGGWPLGYEERRCWANCSRNYFPRFSPMWSWSTNATDGQTDDDMRSQDSALHYSASRGNNSVLKTIHLSFHHFFLKY